MEFESDWVLRYTAEKWPLVRAEIERVLPRKGTHARWLNGPAWYHIGDDCIDPATKKGPKRSRPMFCLLAAECLGVPLEDALPFAAATELAHNYLICHDDVMDGDTSRRDLPAVWVKSGIDHEKRRGDYQRAIARGLRLGDVGIANGINIGDYIMAKSFEAVTSSHLPTDKKAALCDILATTLVKTGEGQALDVNLRADSDFSVDKYFELATLKTGYYLIFGVVGSALLADMDRSSLETLWKLGGNVGVAFQMLDDVIDLTSGKGRVGKNGKPELGNDIREGKPSALFAKVLDCATRPEKQKLSAIFAKPRERTTGKEIAWVSDLYRKYEVVDWEMVDGKRKVSGWAVDEAALLCKQAVAMVDEMKGFGSPEQARKFKALMRFMAKRES
jgi:geranylgeranyl diphosphate synthase type I